MSFEEDKVFSFEESFQNSLMYLLVSERIFYLKFSEHILTHYFTNPLNQIVFKNLNGFFSEFKKLPTFSELREYVLHFETLEEEKSYRNHISILQSSRPETPEYIESQVSTFCKRQSLIKALMSAAEKLSRGRFDDILHEVTSAIGIGEETEGDYDFFDFENVKKRRTSDYREVVPTLIKSFDAKLKGGLAKGELGIIVAAPKKGKTTTMVNIACGALYRGKFVVYITLEMSEDQIAHRFESRISGVTLDGVFEKNNYDVISNKLDNIKNNSCKLLIKRYPTASLSLEKLKKDLQSIEHRNSRKIDILFVDYMTIMKTRSGEASVDGWTELAAGLRGIAGEMDIPVWTAIQTNRGGADVETVTATHISRSYEIIGMADLVISFNQTMAEAKINEARIYIIASRVGPSEIEVPIYVDRDRCLTGDRRISESSVGQTDEERSIRNKILNS